MKITTVLCGLALATVVGVVGGCAAGKEPAPAANHPANPQAAAAPAPKASGTLDESHAAPVPADVAANPGTADAGAPQAYTCPHHPKVMQAETGDCPFCGMALVPTSSRQTSPVRGVTPPGAPGIRPGGA